MEIDVENAVNFAIEKSYEFSWLPTGQYLIWIAVVSIK